MIHNTYSHAEVITLNCSVAKQCSYSFICAFKSKLIVIYSFNHLFLEMLIEIRNCADYPWNKAKYYLGGHDHSSSLYCLNDNLRM